MLLPIPGANFDFASLSFHVPICGFAAKHATVAANDRAVTTAVIRVFICAGDSGRNVVRRQPQFKTIGKRDCNDLEVGFHIRRNYSVITPSGTGHDAQYLARIVPIGMIFAPSVDEISHSPKEFTTPPDVANGASVLVQAILKLDEKGL